MTDKEKFQRLEAIGKHAKLIKQRYGFKKCTPELKESMEMVKAALAERVGRILEA